MRLQYQSFFYIFRTEEFSPWGFLSRKMNEQLFTAAIMPALTGTKLFHGCSTTLNMDKTYHMMLFHEKKINNLQKCCCRGIQRFRMCCYWKIVNFWVIVLITPFIPYLFLFVQYPKMISSPFVKVKAT